MQRERGGIGVYTRFYPALPPLTASLNAPLTNAACISKLLLAWLLSSIHDPPTFGRGLQTRGMFQTKPEAIIRKVCMLESDSIANLVNLFFLSFSSQNFPASGVVFTLRKVVGTSSLKTLVVLQLHAGEYILNSRYHSLLFPDTMSSK